MAEPHNLSDFYLQKSHSQEKPDSQSQHSSQLNVQTEVHLTKKKRILFWIYMLAIFLYLLAMTILAVKSYTPVNDFQQTDSYFYGNQITRQWQTGFIKDIVITTASCPSGYVEAINYVWSGSSFGCHCSAGVNVSFVLSGFCTPSLIQDGCSNMENQDQITVHNWKNNSLICIQRSPVSFFNQQKYDGTNTICGSSQSLVILPVGQTCPFVNVSYTSFALQDNQRQIIDTNNVLSTLHASFNSTSPYSFFTYPLSKFTVSQYQFCMIDEDSGIDPDHSDFVLLNLERGCAQPGNYTELQTQTEIQFYSNNMQLQNLSNLTGFPNPGNWQYKLGFSNLPGWTYKCRHTYNGKFSIPNAVNQLNFDYQDTYNNLLIGETVALVVILLELVVLGLRRCVNSSVYPIGYRQKYMIKNFCWSLSRYLLDWVCKATVLAICIVNVWHIYINYNWFKSALNLNCHDSNLTMVHEIMIPYMNLFDELFNIFIAQIVICSLMAVIDIVYFFYIYRNELSYFLVEPENKMIVLNDTERNQEDNKWADFKEQEEKGGLEIVENQNDEFRVTMAQNIFARDDDDLPKIKKKKRKKFSPFKKVAQEKLPLDQQNGEFNQYLYDDNEVNLEYPDYSKKNNNKKK